VVHFGVCLAINECKEQGLRPVIAEIKTFSPMYGNLLGSRNELDIASIYEKNGAVALSYITAQRFCGNIGMLEKIVSHSSLPVLRKDFVKNEGMIDETANSGASALLLIARLLGDSLEEYVGMTMDCGICPVVEVHTAGEMLDALDTSAPVVLINNRDITRFETDGGDVSVTESIACLCDKRRLIVSASGLSTPADVSRALRVSDAVLVGTSLMRTGDAAGLLRRMAGCL